MGSHQSGREIHLVMLNRFFGLFLIGYYPNPTMIKQPTIQARSCMQKTVDVQFTKTLPSQNAYYLADHETGRRFLQIKSIVCNNKINLDSLLSIQMSRSALRATHILLKLERLWTSRPRPLQV